MRSTSERERRRLDSVASEYRERGYEVKVRPTAADLPDFMVGFEPDLIARETANLSLSTSRLETSSRTIGKSPQ